MRSACSPSARQGDAVAGLLQQQAQHARGRRVVLGDQHVLAGRGAAPRAGNASVTAAAPALRAVRARASGASARIGEHPVRGHLAALHGEDAKGARRVVQLVGHARQVDEPRAPALRQPLHRAGAAQQQQVQPHHPRLLGVVDEHAPLRQPQLRRQPRLQRLAQRRVLRRSTHPPGSSRSASPGTSSARLGSRRAAHGGDPPLRHPPRRGIVPLRRAQLQDRQQPLVRLAHQLVRRDHAGRAARPAPAACTAPWPRARRGASRRCGTSGTWRRAATPARESPFSWIPTSARPVSGSRSRVSACSSRSTSTSPYGTPQKRASRRRYSILSRSRLPETSPCSGEPRRAADQSRRCARARRAPSPPARRGCRRLRRKRSASCSWCGGISSSPSSSSAWREGVVPHVVQQRGVGHQLAVDRVHALQLAAVGQQRPAPSAPGGTRPARGRSGCAWRRGRRGTRAPAGGCSRSRWNSGVSMIRTAAGSRRMVFQSGSRTTSNSCDGGKVSGA